MSRFLSSRLWFAPPSWSIPSGYCLITVTGSILFWKLQAEAFLMSSGLEYAIVKPCGLLSTAAAGQNTLLVGHDDTLLSTAPPIVQRADVAAVMRQALISDTTNLRFDLCSQRGEPNPDLEGILQEARFSWCQHRAC